MIFQDKGGRKSKMKVKGDITGKQGQRQRLTGLNKDLQAGRLALQYFLSVELHLFTSWKLRGELSKEKQEGKVWVGRQRERANNSGANGSQA